ncbi:MAG TPA: glycosyl hydrolase family 79 C-terminal domain-containing protein, partial [Pseudonocardiaceae bacterium]|nr:glycosyl hydrolase family 79 C-terminal domain-containing protein [Pseudonocardiaceae bacterium]
ASALVAALGVAANAAPGAAPVITIDPAQTTTSLNANSEGISLEASDLAIPSFGSGNLAQYFKTLGASILRVGGNTVDQSFWTSSGETAPSWAIATITPAGLANLAKLAQAGGWKVILGVNLKQYDVNRAADEAAHAKAALGSSLAAIEIGNEPNFYYSSTAGYFTAFEAYAKAIRTAAPGVPIEGSDTGTAPNSSFQSAFIANEQAHPDIAELTSHYYPLTSSTCGGNPTIADLLGTGVRNAEKANADEMVTAAAKLKVPGVFDEGNSVVCEGQPGVSNVFASALWEIDDQLVMAREGAAGDYMHGTVVLCNGPKPLYMYYTPFCAATTADANAGNVSAQPEYYGMAFVHQLGTGKFANLSNPAWADVRAYAVVNGSTMKVVLDNVDDPASHGAAALTLDLGATFTGGTRENLTASGLTATSGITLGGQSVQGNGTLGAPATTPVSVNGSTLSLSVNPGSATIITLTK